MRLPPPPGRLVSIGTHRLHLHCEGDGRSVVFDAALGGSSLSWTFVRPLVAREARACVYDRAGFGWSDAGPLPRTAGRAADELHALLSTAGVPPPWLLVGHSFGGLTMRIFASRHAPDVAGLVLLDPASPETWRDPSPARLARIARGARLCRLGAVSARLGIADLVARLARLGAHRTARLTTRVASRGHLLRDDELVLAPAAKLPPAERETAVRFWTQPRFFAMLGSQIASMAASAGEAGAAALPADLPVVVVSSEHATDAEDRARHAALASRSSRGRHLVAAGAGHWIPIDRPDVVHTAIRDALALAGR